MNKFNVIVAMGLALAIPLAAIAWIFKTGKKLKQ